MGVSGCRKCLGRERTTLNPKARKSVRVFWPLFPLYAGAFFLWYGTFCASFPQSMSCTTGIWACTTGWRPALYLCTSTHALGLGVVAQLMSVRMSEKGGCVRGGSRHDQNHHDRRNRQDHQNRHSCFFVLYFEAQTKQPEGKVHILRVGSGWSERGR